jgi:hypothetical protein
MNSDNSSEIASLQRQVFGLIIALILVTATLTCYFYDQVRLARHSVAQANQIINALKQNEPQISAFINQLVAYGQAHPDFVPVLTKYGIAPVKGVPPGAPAGAVPTAPKK